MAMIPAKCTCCGANITVDAAHEAGICPFCGTAFITEKVISNYNITNNINLSDGTIIISGPDTNNLLLRAQQYENVGDYEKACEYYNRILDIDANHKIAKEKLIELAQIYIGGTSISKTDFQNIKHMVVMGKKIDAVRTLRELTGLGLEEAKRFVNNIKQE